MEEYQRTYVEVNLDAISNNIDEVKKCINSNVKILAVIKADAYGHGAKAIGDFLKDKVDYFGVATIEEAVELRKSNINIPILILGYTSPKQDVDLVNYDITQTVYSIEMAEAISKAAIKLGKKSKIHIALETGMNRIGFKVSKESIKEIKTISKMENLILEGMFTHFSCADEKDKGYSNMQMERYDEFVKMLDDNKINIPIKHMCNSAGIIEFNNHRFDMVRSGIITYGLYPSDEVNKERLNLKSALEWKAHIINISEVQENCGVSYGKTYVTNKKTKIATISIGYADGYMRNLSNKGRVLIKGKYAPIIGRVCMDQMMVDVTNINGIELEDEVTLVGRDKENSITIEELSKLAGSFNYEFVCGIGKRVKRIYL
ncbi:MULTISPECIES: alanine racemase [Clostridium]|uniref:alanine racemase n=1 Tax=Clostridium TaxID=1485 RepID=UPI000CDB9462|nr:alanine racemase [Clostridium sp. 3-3]POO88454.1 alanine racemase [Clostridium sp. 3-3]